MVKHGRTVNGGSQSVNLLNCLSNPLPRIIQQRQRTIEQQRPRHQIEFLSRVSKNMNASCTRLSLLLLHVISMPMQAHR